MGKNLIQQRRGKGNPMYVSLGFRSISDAHHVPLGFDEAGEIVDIVKCPNHFAPLLEVRYSSGVNYMIAPEGAYVGQQVSCGVVEQKIGNTLRLADIEEGQNVYNIEAVPGDGGKFVRAPGTFAKLQAKDEKSVTVIMPSKRAKKFPIACRATIGIVAGGGRIEKPLLKAGFAFHKFKAKHKLWPIVGGTSMNAVDHPMGNKRTARKSKARPALHNPPSGRNVGYIRPRRTGRKNK